MQRNTALINISFWFSLWSSAHYSKQKRTVQKATAKKFRLINTYSIYWIASNFFYWKRLQKIQWMDFWRTFLKPYAHAGFERRDFILYSWQNCIKAIICICSLPQISLVSCGRLQFMGIFLENFELKKETIRYHMCSERSRCVEAFHFSLFWLWIISSFVISK